MTNKWRISTLWLVLADISACYMVNWFCILKNLHPHQLYCILLQLHQTEPESKKVQKIQNKQKVWKAFQNYWTFLEDCVFKLRINPLYLEYFHIVFSYSIYMCASKAPLDLLENKIQDLGVTRCENSSYGTILIRFWV